MFQNTIFILFLKNVIKGIIFLWYRNRVFM